NSTDNQIIYTYGNQIWQDSHLSYDPNSQIFIAPGIKTNLNNSTFYFGDITNFNNITTIKIDDEPQSVTISTLASKGIVIDNLNQLSSIIHFRPQDKDYTGIADITDVPQTFTATLVSGTVTVSDPLVASGSIITGITTQTRNGGTMSANYTYVITAGVGYVITGSNALGVPNSADLSTITYNLKY
ncbi:hypothetical protein, partial [uncultured Mucilaginibacter sp.]|uniref:hypothetical protein n=1 Tax=uncultured Mucilaginibacter sp. TaxID=797541 RepID=UPI0025F49383